MFYTFKWRYTVTGRIINDIYPECIGFQPTASMSDKVISAFSEGCAISYFLTDSLNVCFELGECRKIIMLLVFK